METTDKKKKEAQILQNLKEFGFVGNSFKM